MPARNSTFTSVELEARRLTAIRALQEGRSRSEVAAMLGTTHTSIGKWAARYREGGIEKLLARPRGRPSTDRSGAEYSDVRKLLIQGLPDEVGLAEPLWTWRSVQALMFRQIGIEFSRWTVSRYLKEWGFQIPEVTQFENARPAAFVWNPATKAAHLRSCVITSAPLQESTECSVLWAVGGRGEAAFMSLFNRSSEPEATVEFLERLTLLFPKRVLALLGENRLFESELVKAWLERHHHNVQRG